MARRSRRSRSRSLGRSLSNLSNTSASSTAASGTSSRQARFHEGTLRTSNISNTSASTAASGSSSICKRKRSARRGRSSRRSSEQDLSGLEAGEHEESSGHSPEPASAQQLAQEHFWQHKSKYEGRLRAEEEEKAQLLKRDPLHFARRATETDGLGYGMEHVNTHVLESLETKRKQEDSLPRINSRGQSSNGASPMVVGWLSFVEKEAARKIQGAWRRTWRRRHGIPSPLPPASSSSDSDDEPPARTRLQKRASTTNMRVQLQTRRSTDTGAQASRHKSKTGEVTRRSSKTGEDSVLTRRKSASIDSPLGSSKLKDPSKSTDVSKAPGLLKGAAGVKRSSSTLRPSLSQSSEGAAYPRRAQQQQQQRQQLLRQQQQQQEGEQLQWQGSEDRTAAPAQAWRLEAWEDLCQQGGSSGGRPVLPSLAVPFQDMPTAFKSAQAQLCPEDSYQAGSPPKLGHGQQAAPAQATSLRRHAAAATMAGVEGSHAGSGDEGQAAGTAPPLVSNRDLLLAELASQQGTAKRQPPPKSHTFHLVGEKGGQPWGHVLRAQPQPIQRHVSRLSVESSSAVPQLPHGKSKSALSLLAVQGAKSPHLGATHPSLSPSHLTRSLPDLNSSLSSPTGAPTNTTPTTTNTHAAASSTPSATHASFDASEPGSPSRPLHGSWTAFMPGHPHQPSTHAQLPSRPSTAAARTPPLGHSSVLHSSGVHLQPRQRAAAARLHSRSTSNLREVFGTAAAASNASAASPSLLSALPPSVHTERAPLHSRSSSNSREVLGAAAAAASHSAAAPSLLSALPASVHTERAPLHSRPGSVRGSRAEWSDEWSDAPVTESSKGSRLPHVQHAHQQRERAHRQSAPDLGDLQGKSGLPPQRSASQGVTKEEHAHAPKPPVGSPSAEQAFWGRMVLRSRPHKQVPSPSSPTSPGAVDSAALTLALQGKRSSSRARSSSSLLGSSPGQECGSPLQAMSQNDADEQHTAPPSHGTTPFSSTAAHPASASVSSVHSQLSRRFSSTELDPLPFNDPSRRQSSSSVALGVPDTQRASQQCDTTAHPLPFNDPSRRQSSGSVNLDGSSVALGVPGAQRASLQCDTTGYGASPPSVLSGCLSSADAHTLHTKRASSGDGGQGLVPRMPPSPFSKAALAPRPSLRMSGSITAAGGRGQPAAAEAWPPATQHDRRSTGGLTVVGRRQPAFAEAWPPDVKSQYDRRSAGGEALGVWGQPAGATDRPMAVRGKRRVSFVEGVPYTASAAAAAAAAAAGSDPAAESELAAVPPQSDRSSSMGQGQSGNSTLPALQRTSSGGSSSSCALQPARPAGMCTAGTAVVAASAVVDTEAAAAGVPAQRGPVKRRESTGRLG